MWRLDGEETYFRIFDEKKYIAGYFDPIFGEDTSEDEAEMMLHDKSPIQGGHLMVPMIKFGLFDSDLDITIDKLEERLAQAGKALARWSNYVQARQFPYHSIRISHTDQDMLTMTFPVLFAHPVRLDAKDLAAILSPTLDSLQRMGLL